MPIYDQNGLPILGKEDDFSKKNEELEKNLIITKGIIYEMQEKIKIFELHNINLMTFLIYLMDKTENERFRVKTKKLDSIKEGVLEKKIILKSYLDKAKNVVIYKDYNKKELNNEKENKN